MYKKCNNCGDNFYVRPSHADKRKHCSKDCMAETYKKQLRGDKNPNYKDDNYMECINCNKTFHSYDKRRKYCCVGCYRNSKISRNQLSGYYKDNNHDKITSRLTKFGCKVIDTSMVAYGFPDIIVLKNGNIYLLEIKNPNSSHGLTNQQVKFHESWNGQIDVVNNFEEAKQVIEKYEASHSN